MNFTGKIEKHEQLIAVHRATDTLIDARASEDQIMELGGSAYLKLDIVKGLPVDSATINVNFWNVYRTDDSELIGELLARLFRED